MVYCVQIMILKNEVHQQQKLIPKKRLFLLPGMATSVLN